MNNTVYTHLLGFLSDFDNGHRAVRQYARLNALSDAALKSRGLTRSALPGVSFERARRG